MAKKYTVLETWIVNETKPTDADSAVQSYDRMAKQGGGELPVIDVEQNLRNEKHFLDEAQIRDFVAHMAGAQDVLDIGPGDGWPLLRIAPFFKTVTGIDASAKRVEVCRANAERLGIANVTLKQTSAVKMEFGDNSFDGVVAACSFEQTPDAYQAVREAFRVLKPGGRLRVWFESFDRREKGITEKLFLTEGEDFLGYHYMLQHNSPPWERNYLVKFNPTPEVKEQFTKLADLIGRLGPNPSQNPELGLQFMERNKEAIAGSTWYELEHFTSASMKETLEEAGFVNVRVAFAASTLARTVWQRVKDSELTDVQTKAVLQGVADMAVRLDAPVTSGEPVAALKPN